MYFAEWNKARKALREHGRSPAEADALRMKIHVKVGAVDRLGQPKSSKALNNREIDRCLAEFWVWSEPLNLNAQLRQLDQPFTRAMGSEEAVFFLKEIGVEEADQKRYLDTICRRIFKKPLMDLADHEWPDVLAALNHTRMHKQGIAHGHRRKAAPVAPQMPQEAPDDEDEDRPGHERREIAPAAPAGGQVDENVPF
jgi:hypothetical protein